ncbi:Aste57867_14744 [Aphanomyces stellatus]|uniref:Aste57867_14744 protein n=1 Tax=Aphanomyces stellatus TaxID=120398 RepID=A0A485L2F2_9STRA|nr:hypothetical protein As57867_014689 [Aphanomyces stellatus]VFT91562.1 Aste57867_14744 [Aphanomyces stellatus]
MDEAAIRFRVRRATGSSFEHPVANLADYSRKTHWASFAKPTEVVVLQLDTKALVGEIRVFNKNAHAVDVSLAVDDKKDEYIKVKSNVRIPLNREFRIKTGYFPASFIRLAFHRQNQSSVAVYGVQAVGVSCGTLEQNGGPALYNVVGCTTENILFGSSLPASLPKQDCLSDTISGSPAWMKRHQSLLDGHIARLENSLRDYTHPPPRRLAASWLY